MLNLSIKLKGKQCCMIFRGLKYNNCVNYNYNITIGYYAW